VQRTSVLICGAFWLFSACTTPDPIVNLAPEDPSPNSGGFVWSTTDGDSDDGEGGTTGTAPATSAGTSTSGDGDGDVSSAGDGDVSTSGDGDVSGDGDGDVSTAGDGDGGDGDATAKCGEPPVVTGDFSKQRLLESAAACSTYQACLFSKAAEDLERQVISYSAEPSAEGLAQARSAWADAMNAWALVVPNQFGPIAGVAVDTYYGRGIGAFIHAWPSHNRCEIEKQVVNRGYEQGFQSVLPTARGLAALEYLLFYGESDTACSVNSAAGKAWAQLSADDITSAKLDYAEAVAGDVLERSDELVSVWSEDGEDFGAKLAAHDGYGSQQEALNVVAWSLLYPYNEIRDLQVGPLAGIGDALPNPVSPYGHVDLQSIRRNLQAFRALFQGCGQGGAGIGFDDWLNDVGAADLASDIVQALDVVDGRAAQLPPLHEATTEQLTAFYAELKVLSDLLKGQFFGSGSVLNLKLPAGVASDTD
ncbi:MAG TPA: imelysin family protein, partial [Polyangiaceae bacterium]|nr:imelysin family protein [Polyangiaceae bacterium]